MLLPTCRRALVYLEDEVSPPLGARSPESYCPGVTALAVAASCGDIGDADILSSR